MKFQNPLLAVFALLISLGFWVYVSIQKETSTEDVREPGQFPNIEVKLVGKPPGFIAQDPLPTVTMAAAGSRAEIDRLTQAVLANPSLIEVQADVSKAEVGEKKYPVHFQVPKGYDVKWTPISVVKVKFDMKITREIPVDVFSTGLPPEGYLSDRQSAEPKVVTVEGWATSVNEIDRARVSVDLSELTPTPSFTASVKRRVDLLKSNGGLSDEKCSPAEVTVYATLAPKPNSKRLIILPNYSGTPALGYRLVSVNIEPNQVVVLGPSEKLAALSSVDIKPISVAGLKETRQFTTTLQLPEGVKEAKPTRIRVTVVMATADPTPKPTPTNVPSPNPTGTPPPQ